MLLEDKNQPHLRRSDSRRESRSETVRRRHDEVIESERVDPS